MVDRTQTLSEVRPVFWVALAGPFETLAEAYAFVDVTFGHEKVYAACSKCGEVVNPDTFGLHLNASHVVWR